MGRGATGYLLTLIVVPFALWFAVPATAVQPELGPSGGTGASGIIGNFDVRMLDRTALDTVIDDTAVLDLNLTVPTNGPFTGSYTPAFNSILWDILDLGSDPVGQLSHLTGLSTLGDWKVHVTDEAPFNTGRLNSWSLIVTPTKFVCSAPPPPSTVALAGAILPSSRSPQVGTPATAFATIVAAGTGTDCSIVPITDVPAFFSYQTTDRKTNALTGAPNTPVSIAANDFQTFVISVTPFAAFGPTELQLSFDCANSQPAPVFAGLTTLLVSGSNGPTADVLAFAATPTSDGIVNIPGPNATGAFAVATFNVGASALITASVDTGKTSLPVNAFICLTDPVSGSCISSIGTTVTTRIDAGHTPTFAIFAQGTGHISFDPANHRLFVRLKDANNVTRGSTSVAVRTQ